MVKLTAALVFEDAGLPVTVGDCQILPLEGGHVFSVMPFNGQEGAVSQAMTSELGLGLSDVGKWHLKGELRIIWAGLDQWLIETPEPLHLSLPAALCDQSDGWARLRIEGPGARDVMRRLCPLDVDKMRAGEVARTETDHMMSIVIALDHGFEVWVMRSFAKTLLHSVRDAAKNVAAIKALRS